MHEALGLFPSTLPISPQKKIQVPGLTADLLTHNFRQLSLGISLSASSKSHSDSSKV
jgi:hypothetical protein